MVVGQTYPGKLLDRFFIPASAKKNVWTYYKKVLNGLDLHPSLIQKEWRSIRESETGKKKAIREIKGCGRRGRGREKTDSTGWVSIEIKEKDEGGKVGLVIIAGKTRYRKERLLRGKG